MTQRINHCKSRGALLIQPRCRGCEHQRMTTTNQSLFSKKLGLTQMREESKKQQILRGGIMLFISALPSVSGSNITQDTGRDQRAHVSHDWAILKTKNILMFSILILILNTKEYFFLIVYNESLYTRMFNKATEMSSIQRRWKLSKILKVLFSKQVCHILIQSFLIKLVSGQHNHKITCWGKELQHFQVFFHNNKLSLDFFSPVFRQGSFPVNSIYALLLPALKEVWLRELEFKMGLNPGFDCTFTAVFGTGEQGVSPNGYRYHCFSKQDSLANGRVILAECYPH